MPTTPEVRKEQRHGQRDFPPRDPRRGPVHPRGPSHKDPSGPGLPAHHGTARIPVVPSWDRKPKASTANLNLACLQQMQQSGSQTPRGRRSHLNTACYLLRSGVKVERACGGKGPFLEGPHPVHSVYPTCRSRSRGTPFTLAWDGWAAAALWCSAVQASVGRILAESSLGL